MDSVEQNGAKQNPGPNYIDKELLQIQQHQSYSSKLIFFCESHAQKMLEIELVCKLT